MILKVVVIFIMLIGLLGTLLPKVPGTLMIVGGAIIYSAFSGVHFRSWLTAVLVVLMIIAEVGGRFLRYYLTYNSKVSLFYSANSTVGNAAGLIVANALFGPVIGLLIWEMLSGKTWTARSKEIAMVLIKAMSAAILKFFCGLIMIILILTYLFL